jgi:hypothetical protein
MAPTHGPRVPAGAMCSLLVNWEPTLLAAA